MNQGSTSDHNNVSSNTEESTVSTDELRASDLETRSDQNEQHVPSQPPPNNRSILILREIEPNSPESAVRDLFNSENCPSKPIHCEHALRNSWYVAFKSDEDATLALQYIRKYTVKWKGEPIMAGHKPKRAVPSATSQPPPRALPHMVMPVVGVVDNGIITISSSSSSSISSGPSTNIIDGSSAPPVITSAPSGPPELNQVSRTGPDLGHAEHPVVGQPTYPPPNPMLHIGAHMISPPPPTQHHRQHHHMASAQHYGYSPVAYYGQHNSTMTPWHYASAPPQYDLSEVFIYNGLTPYPSGVKSGNPKLTSGGVSSASLLGGEVAIQHQMQQHQHQQQNHHHHHHHPHQHQQHHHTNNHRHQHHQINPSNQHMYGPPSSNGIKSSGHQGRNKNSKHK